MDVLAYVRAIRQAYRDALAGDPESDYYASRLGRAEEEEEVLEPHLDRDLLYIGRLNAWDPAAATAAPAVESRMECESVDAAEPAPGPTPSDLCVCGHTLYVHALTFCDVVSHYEVDDCLCSGFHLADASPTLDPSTAADDSQTAAVEVTTPGEYAAVAVREVLAEHHPFEGAGGIECAPEWADFEYPYCIDHLLHFADKHDWREHVAAEVARRIDAAVGVTPTPKPTKQPTFPCVVTDCPERFAEYDELNTHSYWEHLEPDPFKTSDDPLVRYERYPGASPTGDFRWFSIKVTSPTPKPAEEQTICACGHAPVTHDSAGCFGCGCPSYRHRNPQNVTQK